MIRISRVAAILAVALGLGASAMATPIFGVIGFSGAVTTDTGTLSTANALTFNTASVVGFVGTGDYAGIPNGTAVTFQNFSFDPFVPPVTPLWTFTYLGLTYSFKLDTVIVTQGLSNNFPGPPDPDTQFLNLSGQGVASITGFEDTPGTFFFSTQGGIVNTTAPFTFSANNEVLPEGVVPEPGTLLLLGSGISALALRRRRKA